MLVIHIFEHVYKLRQLQMFSTFHGDTKSIGVFSSIYFILICFSFVCFRNDQWSLTATRTLIINTNPTDWTLIKKRFEEKKTLFSTSSFGLVLCSRLTDIVGLCMYINITPVSYDTYLINKVHCSRTESGK